MTATLLIKVVPRATTDEVVGWLGRELKVRVAAVPEAGRANAAVEALIAELVGVAKSTVAVTWGHTSARKRIEIRSLEQQELDRRLRAAGF